MDIIKLDAAINEARRFIVKAGEVKSEWAKDSASIWSSKETGACKRASMDLTRALAELRKP